MRVHRFYIGEEIELEHDFWLHDQRLVSQWRKVLRFKPGQELILFDGRQHERLYRLTELSEREAHLRFVTDFVRRTPSKEISLFWSLLKKDKNEWVLQKCTELGASHFIPLLAERSEKTGFNRERSRRILIEAAEQCGRSDVPVIREPMLLETAIDDYRGKLRLLVCDQSDDDGQAHAVPSPAGLLVGPEGGWSDRENDLFSREGLERLNLHGFTLRAETACAIAVQKACA